MILVPRHYFCTLLPLPETCDADVCLPVPHLPGAPCLPGNLDHCSNAHIHMESGIANSVICTQVVDALVDQRLQWREGGQPC